MTLKLLLVETDDGDEVGRMMCRKKYLFTEVGEIGWRVLQGTQKWELVFLG